MICESKIKTQKNSLSLSLSEPLLPVLALFAQYCAWCIVGDSSYCIDRTMMVMDI